MLHTVNPANGQPIETYQLMADSELLSTIEKSGKAFDVWRRVDFGQRAQLFAKMADHLEQQLSRLSQLVTLEMGKPLPEAEAEVKKCVWGCRYYAENGPKFLADQSVATDSAKSYVSFRPLGTVLAIMPWNFPLWQVFRFAAPTMIAGNAVLLKHSPNTTGCALAIAELFSEVGFPSDVFQTLVVEVEQVPEILAHPQVQGVSLTGSTRAGRAVATLAGQHLKRSVLELGGNDAYVILDDADIDLAVDKIVTSRMLNCGQSCIAAKRWIVTEKNAAEFTQKALAALKNIKWGHPTAADTQVGPMAREDLRKTLHQQVMASQNQGAKVLLGGEIPPGPGFYYPPTLLAEVRPGMPAFDEELFGPVGAIIEAQDEAQALNWANQSDYGLGAAVFSADTGRAEKIAREQLPAGSCFVNDFVRSDPRLPFGGIKQSGYGRELAEFGIHEFVNIKTIVR